MVAGKHPTSYFSGNTRGIETGEIRSGMSVQDLKQLTAQRAQRQRVEYFEQARGSPRQPSLTTHDWSSLAGSPPRHYVGGYGGYPSYSSSRRKRSPSTSPGSGPERMFVTCGGQVVSFMEGVVNAPQIDVPSEILSPL